MATRSYLTHEACAKRAEKLLDLIDQALDKKDYKAVEAYTAALKNLFTAANAGLVLTGQV
jgi:hypothetical protein